MLGLNYEAEAMCIPVPADEGVEFPLLRQVGENICHQLTMNAIKLELARSMLIAS